jgi:hypothetical protein
MNKKFSYTEVTENMISKYNLDNNEGNTLAVRVYTFVRGHYNDVDLIVKMIEREAIKILENRNNK